MAEATINMGEAARSVTLQLKVTGLRKFRLRLWLASQVFRLGAAIAGTGIEIEST